MLMAITKAWWLPVVILLPDSLPSARMRSEGYCSWVCVSVKSHLTYGASVRPENAVTYSAGNEGQKICGVFSETAPLQRSSTPSIVRPCVQSAIFPGEITHAYYSMGLAPPSVFPLPPPLHGCFTR